MRPPVGRFVALAREVEIGAKPLTVVTGWENRGSSRMGVP
jgi:hypothetical protein